MEFARDYQLGTFKKVTTSSNTNFLQLVHTPVVQSYSRRSPVRSSSPSQKKFPMKQLCEKSQDERKMTRYSSQQQVENAQKEATEQEVNLDKMIQTVIPFEHSVSLKKRIKDRCTRLISRPQTARSSLSRRREESIKNLERQFD